MLKPVIKVLGVGGSGSNTVARLSRLKLLGVELIAANTDAQALQVSNAHKKILIGENVTRGLGTGMDVDLGKRAAIESKEEILKILKGSDLVFLTCGLGGGTGSGGIPVIAELSKELNILTVGVVTTPFSFEGEQRKKIAKKTLADLKERVDSLIVVSNDKILKLINQQTSFNKAFMMCDEILGEAIQGIADLVFSSGIIRVDFASIISILKNSGIGMFGVGRGTGEQRALLAAQKAFSSPLLEFSIKGAQGVLFNITGQKLTLKEIQEAAKLITQNVDPKAKIIFGAGESRNLSKDEIKISLIATKMVENLRID